MVRQKIARHPGTSGKEMEPKEGIRDRWTWARGEWAAEAGRKPVRHHRGSPGCGQREILSQRQGPAYLLLGVR